MPEMEPIHTHLMTRLVFTDKRKQSAQERPSIENELLISYEALRAACKG